VRSLGPKAMTIEEGIDFIVSHFEEPIWPRPIFTPKEKQVPVYDREEALASFKRASLLDCRINAYPDYTGIGGMNRQAPNFIFIDLDLSCFSSRDSLDRALRAVLKNIKEKFNGAQATVIWSGNGYHIYLPIEAFILELGVYSASLSNHPKSSYGSQKKRSPITKQTLVIVVICLSKIAC
jgi:hypothetical protein